MMHIQVCLFVLVTTVLRGIRLLIFVIDPGEIRKFIHSILLYVIDPTTCSGNGIYSSFRNRNFWLEYSTPPTTKYPEYDDDDYYLNTAGPPTTPDPRPHFVDSISNHTLVQSPLGSTAFLNCRVDDLKDYQVYYSGFFGSYRFAESNWFGVFSFIAAFIHVCFCRAFRPIFLPLGNKGRKFSLLACGEFI
jgi:hypothetical protein